jgi:hypothetical protein
VKCDFVYKNVATKFRRSLQILSNYFLILSEEPTLLVPHPFTPSQSFLGRAIAVLWSGSHGQGSRSVSASSTLEVAATPNFNFRL